MRLKYKHLVWFLALLVASSFDQMFWQKPGGINFFIFAMLVILGGLIPVWLEKIHIPWSSYLLIIPVGFFAFMTYIRAEPFTIITNGLITIATIILFWISLLNGAWYKFRIQDILINLFKFGINCFTGGILFFLKVKTEQSSLPGNEPDVQMELDEEIDTGSSLKPETPGINNNRFLKQISPYLRGVLLALPILAILSLLLANADPVFNNRLLHLFSWFELENLGEIIFRMFYILVIAYLLLSAYFFGLVESGKWQDVELEKPLLHPFLGSIEAGIVLGSINLLFLLFVILQFTYLFGGRANISVEGFTFAEYARRGFFELLVVALISLLLFYILSVITKRETKAKRWTFSASGLVLVSLVAIILVSAYTRLTLYETAFGFTRLRTLTHIFIIWTGLLLAAIATLEITKRMDRWALILICFIFGFGLTVNFLNIDRFIVQQNITRTMNATEDDISTVLDTGYLSSLSTDSIPHLVRFFTNPQTSNEMRENIGGILACQSASLDLSQKDSWTSRHLSRSRAILLLQDQSKELEKYPVFDDRGWQVEVNGEVKPCYTSNYID